MWQTTTETQLSDKALLTMAHLGIWLQSRHWGSGHPSLLCTFSIHRGGKEGGGDSKESSYSAGLNLHTNKKGEPTQPRESGVGAEGGSSEKENGPQKQYFIKSSMLETGVDSTFTYSKLPTCEIMFFSRTSSPRDT